MSNESIVNNELTSKETMLMKDSLSTNKCRLTTLDNPYDPFEQFNLWFMFDIEKGYYTCSRLARIAKTTDDMSDVEVDREVERAIDEIIKYDFMNVYKKVIKNT